MPKSKLLLLTLFASLIINLFLLGGIAYRVTSFREFGPRPVPTNLSWIVRDLSEARRNELAPLLEQNRSDSAVVRREMFNAQRSVNELMASPDFNAMELEEAFSQLRELGLRYQELSHQQFLEILNQLTTEERLAVRDFIQRRGPRDGHRGRDGRPPQFGFRPDSGRTSETGEELSDRGSNGPD